MNSLKNLLIIVVLGAVGYGVYASFACNNVAPNPPPDATAGWPSPPKVDMPGVPTSPQHGGALALGGSSPPPAAAVSGAGGTALSAMPNSSSAPSSPNAMSGMTSANLAAPSQNQAPADISRNLLPPTVTPAGNAATPATSSTDRLVQSKVTEFINDVRKYLDEGKLAEAHAALSVLYGNPDLAADQAKQINDLLDQLAGTVIYSRKHLLEPAYFAQSGDTLETVAQRYKIPWQLLARINGLMPPGDDGIDSRTPDQPLPVGMELKVVRGPFDAVVHLDRHELTLMLEKRYAGRFAIGTGRDQPKLEGEYVIREKLPKPTYCSPDGANFGPDDPRNPLGAAWIGLGDRTGIHGANNPQAIGRDDNQGAICVGQRDLQDLYGILSVGSRVIVTR